MSILKLNNVSYRYGRGTPFEKIALDNVTYSFEQGKITGIIGHTGSGKSTMVELLCGLIKPDSGHILYDGRDINISRSALVSSEMEVRGIKKPLFGKLFSAKYRSSLKEICDWADEYRSSVRFGIGLVMQYPEYQLFDDTVISDIGFGPRNMGMTPEQAQRASEKAASYVGLDTKLYSVSPFDLSGGEKRRAAVAGVLSMEPKVLILDEPSAGLDPRGKKVIYDLILNYRERTGATVIVVSHSMEDLAKYCDNVVVLKNGNIINSGAVSEIMGTPEVLLEAGLDMPESCRIASKLLEAGVPLNGTLYTVEGLRDAILSYVKEGRA